MILSALLSLPQEPALAGYSSTAAELPIFHQAHIFDFEEAPILFRPPQSSREAGLVKSLAVLNQLREAIGEEPINTTDILTAYSNLELARSWSEWLGEPRFHEEEELFDGTIVLHRTNATVVDREGEFQVIVRRNGYGYTIRMPPNDPETLGNSEFYLDEFAAEALASVTIADLNLVPVADRSQLMFVKTRYLHFTGKEDDKTDRVVSTEVSFGRIINDIPFVGHGSIIRIEFTAEGRVASLNVDWPILLETYDYQGVAPQTSFDDRIRGYLNEADLAKVLEPTEVDLHTIVCGYVDPGAASDEAYVELGCLIAFTIDSANAQATVIPLGTGVSAQAAWGGIGAIETIESNGTALRGEYILNRYSSSPDAD